MSDAEYLVGLYREGDLVAERRADFEGGELNEPLSVESGDLVMVAYPNAAENFLPPGPVMFGPCPPCVVTSVVRMAETFPRHRTMWT